jgi:hypothetical protein
MAARIAEGIGLFELVNKALEELRSGFEGVTTGAMEWGESISRTATSTGASVEQVQAFNYAAAIASCAYRFRIGQGIR